MNRPCFALSVLLASLTGSLLAVGSAHSQNLVDGSSGVADYDICPLAGDEFYGDGSRICNSDPSGMAPDGRQIWVPGPAYAANEIFYYNSATAGQEGDAHAGQDFTMFRAGHDPVYDAAVYGLHDQADIEPVDSRSGASIQDSSPGYRIDQYDSGYGSFQSGESEDYDNYDYGYHAEPQDNATGEEFESSNKATAPRQYVTDGYDSYYDDYESEESADYDDYGYDVEEQADQTEEETDEPAGATSGTDYDDEYYGDEYYGDEYYGEDYDEKYGYDGEESGDPSQPSDWEDTAEYDADQQDDYDSYGYDSYDYEAYEDGDYGDQYEESADQGQPATPQNTAQADADQQYDYDSYDYDSYDYDAYDDDYYEHQYGESADQAQPATRQNTAEADADQQYDEEAYDYDSYGYDSYDYEAYEDGYYGDQYEESADQGQPATPQRTAEADAGQPYDDEAYDDNYDSYDYDAYDDDYYGQYGYDDDNVEAEQAPAEQATPDSADPDDYGQPYYDDYDYDYIYDYYGYGESMDRREASGAQISLASLVRDIGATAVAQIRELSSDIASHARSVMTRLDVQDWTRHLAQQMEHAAYSNAAPGGVGCEGADVWDCYRVSQSLDRPTGGWQYELPRRLIRTVAHSLDQAGVTLQETSRMLLRLTDGPDDVSQASQAIQPGSATR